MFLFTLPMKIFGLTGTIVLAVVLYWLFIGTGMNLNRSGKCDSGVAVSAKNPVSGVNRTFSNECKIPVGWQKGAAVAL